MVYIKLYVEIKEINYILKFTDHYFTGEYPIEPSRSNGKMVKL